MLDIVSIPRAISDLARERPEEPAIIVDGEPCSWAALDSRSSFAAARLLEEGVSTGGLVAIAARNDIDFFISVLAAYKTGGIPMPLSSRLTARERREILAVAQPEVLIGFDSVGESWPAKRCLDGLWSKSADFAPHIERVPNELAVVSPSWKAPTSGGSTGRPKVIVATDGAAINRAGTAGMMMRKSGCVCIPGPMYHNAPFSYAIRAITFGNTLVTSSKRFASELTLKMVADTKSYWLLLVPTMMHRILRDQNRREEALDSLECMWHVGAKCPAWVKDGWIRWLGPDRVFELYAGTEAQAIASISGSEWLRHRESVGRVTVGEISIRDDHGVPLPHGVTGEIFMRPRAGRLTYRYIGARAKVIDGGWESLGDIGHFDTDGYLYVSDRLTDMIVTGGANVYPAEVEAAIEETEGVIAAVVVGIADDEFGSVVAAVVQVAEQTEVTVERLLNDLGYRLARYKIPRFWRLTTTALRDDAGKVRRASWRDPFAQSDE